MRWNIVRAIYLKELRETLRDRRTVTFMLLLPLLLYPLMIIGLSRFQRNLEKESSERTAKVTIWGDVPADLAARLEKKNFTVAQDGMPAGLMEKLRSNEIGPFEQIPDGEDSATEKKAEEIRDRAVSHPLSVAARPLILERKTDLVLILWPQPEGKEGLRETAILFDSVRQDSRRARTRINSVLAEYRLAVIAEREKRHNLDAGFSRVMRAEARDIAPKARRSGFSIGMTLPFLLLAISATAGFYRAVDTTAGEKERNTMQTLLCAPVRSIEIMTGKFAAISTITMIAAGANIASLGLTFANVSAQIGTAMTMTPIQYALVFVVMVPVTLLTSALFLAVGVFAKDFRDGQNLLTPVMMLTMMPAAVTMLPGVELNTVTLMLPCVNVALLIKALLVGEAKPDHIFLTLISSSAYAMLALTFAARVFERESLLTGGKDTIHGLFGFGGKRREITPSLAFASFCLVLVLIFYGNVLPKMDMKYMLLTIEYALILLPTLALVAALKLPMPSTLSIRWPGWKPMLGGALAGSSAWAVANLFLRLLEPPEDLAKAMQKVLMLDRSDIPVLWIYFLVSISPAICEELFFRGLVQGGFRRMGMWTSIILSAFLFGIAHGSIYRMMPVTFLGLVIGWMFWHSKSVLPGVLAHALNNGIAISFVTVPFVRNYITSNKITQMPVSWSIAASAILLAGLLLVSSSTRKSTSSDS